VLRLSVATTIIILSADFTVTFIANILLSMCELYNSHAALRSQTVFNLCSYKYYNIKTRFPSPLCTAHPHNRLVYYHDNDHVMNDEDIEP
jgi:hypothetical protein